MAYGFETDIEKLADQANVGVQPMLKDLIAARMRKDVFEQIEQVKQDASKLIEEVALDISKRIEAQIISARNPMDSKVEIVIAIDRKKVFNRITQEFVTQEVQGAGPTR